MSTLHEYVSPVAWVGPHRELVIVVSLVGVSLLGVPPAGVRRVRGLDAAIHDARRPGNPVFGPRTVSSWRCRSMMVSGRLGVVRLESGDTLCAFPKVSQGGKRERDLNVLSKDVKRYYDKRVTSSGIWYGAQVGLGCCSRGGTATPERAWDRPG